MSPTALTRATLLTAPILALCSTSASAQAVIPVDLTIGPSDLNQKIFVNLGTLSASTVANSDYNAPYLIFYYAHANSTKPEVSAANRLALHIIHNGAEYTIARYAFGEVIPSSPIIETAAARLPSEPGTYYFGFHFDSQDASPVTYFGYGEVSMGNDGSIAVSHVAFDAGQITVGATSAIPEPSTYAAAAGLLAGSAALLRRRQQRKADLANA